jgi:hypothetical protein
VDDFSHTSAGKEKEITKKSERTTGGCPWRTFHVLHLHFVLNTTNRSRTWTLSSSSSLLLLLLLLWFFRSIVITHPILHIRLIQTISFDKSLSLTDDWAPFSLVFGKNSNNNSLLWAHWFGFKSANQTNKQ